MGLPAQATLVVDLAHIPDPEDIGQPLHGLGYNDRIFIDTSTSTLAIGLGVTADNVDVSAAMHSLSFDLVGNGSPDARLLAYVVTVLKDPGTQSADHRLYLTEEFNRPGDVLDLNKFDATSVPPAFGPWEDWSSKSRTSWSATPSSTTCLGAGRSKCPSISILLFQATSTST